MLFAVGALQSGMQLELFNGTIITHFLLGFKFYTTALIWVSSSVQDPRVYK